MGERVAGVMAFLRAPLRKQRAHMSCGNSLGSPNFGVNGNVRGSVGGGQSIFEMRMAHCDWAGWCRATHFFSAETTDFSTLGSAETRGRLPRLALRKPSITSWSIAAATVLRPILQNNAISLLEGSWNPVANLPAMIWSRN